MTLEELRDNIKAGQIVGEQDAFAKGYNMAIKHSLMMIGLYEKYQEKEVEKIYVKDLGVYDAPSNRLDSRTQ